METEKDKKPEIPVWRGVDTVISKEIYVVGPDGEKVDVMTFRGAIDRDLNNFAKSTPEFVEAIENEDDDNVERIMREDFLFKPEWYYSPDKLIKAFGIPAPLSSFAYHILGKKKLPSKEQLVDDTVDSLAARFNLRYSEQKWLQALARLVIDDSEARQQFLEDDLTVFTRAQFTQLGGVQALRKFSDRENVFEALRQSTIIRQSLSGGLNA